MAMNNEDLLMEMHRVGALMRRCAHTGHRHMHDHAHRGSGGHLHDAPEGASPDIPAGQHRGFPMEHADRPACPHAHGEAPQHPHGKAAYCRRAKGRIHHGRARILAMLQMQDGITQKDLAFLLGIRPQSLTVALDKLEEEGLIERRQDDSDKRVRKVFITKEGAEKAESQAKERAGHADKAFSALTEQEKEQLSAILEKLGAALEQEHKEE